MNTKAVLCALAIALLFSCQSRPDVREIGSEKKSTISVASDDPVMLAIIEDARASVSEFLSRQSRPADDESGFQVKYPFETDPGSDVNYEHIWLDNVILEDGEYFGTIANDPEYISDLAYGDVVMIDIDSISDWMYVKAGKIIGGKSIKYLIEKIPEDERTGEYDEILSMFD